MTMEMNKSPSVRLTPGQELKLAQPATQLYVGQILKTVVVTPLDNDQVLININGQNLNAKSAHHFKAGELLEVKVIANQGETVLEVQHPESSASVLQKALLLNLPKQAPAINLLNTLNQLAKSQDLPPNIAQQIKTMLNTIIPVARLPQQLMNAIKHSGLFLEGTLFQLLLGNPTSRLKSDFKGQCLKLLNMLPESVKNNTNILPELDNNVLEQDPLPLPGVIPQPLQKDFLFCLLEKSSEELFSILGKQLTQVIARITASQINHLSHDKNEGYLIMLDLPIRTAEHIDVIPLMIKQQKAAPMQFAKWSISFALSLDYLGDMQATASIYDQNIDIKINAKEANTVATLDEYRDEMSQVLNHLGLKLQEWKLQHGLENNQIDVANLRLLDLRI